MGGYWLCDTPREHSASSERSLRKENATSFFFDSDVLGTCESAEEGVKLLTEDRAYKAACGLDFSAFRYQER